LLSTAFGTQVLNRILFPSHTTLITEQAD